jgi:hypothetical protein
LELVDDLRRSFRVDEPMTAVLGRSTSAGQAAPVPVRTSRRRRGWLLPVALVALLAAGMATAAVVADDDTPEARTVTRERTTVSTVSGTTSTVTVTETAPAPAETETELPPPRDDVDGAALNDAGFAEMQAGDFEAALPLLEQAASALEGSGTLAEAYASYNLAYTRFALGSCDGVLELLDRSQSVQGQRSEIDRLRRDAERTCDGGEGDD